MEMGTMANTVDIGDITEEGVSPKDTVAAKDSYGGFGSTTFTSLDLEMNQPSGKIIQVGAVVGDVHTGVILDKFRMFVRIDEPLDDRIAALCGITQEQLDHGVSLVEAYKQLSAFHLKYGSVRGALTWGGDDSTYLLERVFAELGLAEPSPGQPMYDIMKATSTPWVFGRRSFDVKTVFQAYAIANGMKPVSGLKKSCKKMGVLFDGPAHDAEKDALNTFKIFSKLIQLYRQTSPTASA